MRDTRRRDIEPAARTERDETIEHRLVILAEQVFVTRLPDAEVERFEPALATMLYQLEERLFAGALGLKTVRLNRVEHCAEPLAVADSGEGRDDFGADRERIDFDRRPVVVSDYRGLEKILNIGVAEHIGLADLSHPRDLLLKEYVEHTQRVRVAAGPRENH